MKRILLIFFLFHSLLNGQSLEGQQIGGKPALRTNSTLINISDNAGLNPSSPLGYVQRAVDFFKRVTDAGKTLTDAQKRWYNDSIFVPGINHGYIGTTRAGDSLVALYSFSLKWAGDSTVANMNLLADQYNCIHYGTVTYTDSGVVGNGNSGYLNTFFNPVSDSSIYKNLSASLLIYSKTNNSGNVIDIGVQTSTIRYSLILSFLTDKTYVNINGGGLPTFNNNTSLGVYIVSRLSTTVLTAYKNGVAQTLAGTQTIDILPNYNFYICAMNNNNTAAGFTTRVYPFAVIGSGLSATKSASLSDALNNALKGYGYNVY